MKSKDKQKSLLREIVKVQQRQYKLAEKFSYKFDHRSGRLILCYSVPKLKEVNGKLKTYASQKEKYINEVNIENWKKFFNGSRSLVKDHAQFVANEKEKADSKSGIGDQYELRYWVETYLIRTIGHTKTMKVLSPDTIRQNKHYVNDYVKWLDGNHKNTNDLFDHVDNAKEWFEDYYRDRLSEDRWSPATIGIAYRNIRGFYNYVADKHPDNFPYDLLKRVKIPKAQNMRDQLNPDEFNNIIDFIQDNETDAYFGKFILMLRLQMKTGMRCGEVVNIRIRNIDLANRKIQITGKGSLVRDLNLNHEGDDKIWDQIVAKMDKEAIFLFYRTKIRKYPKLGISKELDVDKKLPTTTSYFLQRFREMREKLGLRKNTTSHSVRRYFITQFLKNNPNRDLVRMIVGHQSTRMTDYYVGNMIDPTTKTTIDLPI